MTFNEQGARDWLRQNVRSHVPATARKYHARILTLTAPTNMLGVKVDHRPFKGRVIHVAPEFTAFKISGQNDFVLADPVLFADRLVEGTTVKVVPYQRRHFSGATFAEPAIERYENGVEAQVFRIGQVESTIPLPHEPQTGYLEDLMTLLHRGICPDGVRVISNMLVDCNARSIDIQEPDLSVPGDIRDPQFSFDCTTDKFTGRVVIGLDMGADAYYVHLLKPVEGETPVLAAKHDYVLFDELADLLTLLLCDGKWAKAKVEVLKAAPKAKALAETAEAA